VGNCITTQFIQNAGNATDVRIRQNHSLDATGKTQATWINSFTGVLEHDIDIVNATSTGPGTRVNFPSLGFPGSTSGNAIVTPQAVAGTPTLTLPNASGTFVVSASAPLVANATTGN